MSAHREPDGRSTSTGAGIGAFGSEIRRTRQRLGLSVEQLADRSGVSLGLVSQLERGQGNPSFQTLTRLADGLGMPLVALLQGAQERVDPVVRASARTRMPDLDPSDDDPPGMVRELLTPHLHLPLQVIRTEMPPGFTNESRPFRHLGLECVHVLSGALLVTLGADRHELGPGDSITYECTQAHWWANLADGPTVVLGSVTPYAT
ncbi:helix-turn-helix domain-containing protein [Oerskovia flava]|uniref:helix-turn-helix domain-containing protein n=1 Tax=Oerskovia flava TaxID=2986422 RepID=UPI0022407A31|nr:XRE family transcriptional regulator [Oerskovia sp. JB1-3-2]